MDSQSPIAYFNGAQWKNAKCDQCLHKYLGDRVDIQWNIKNGKMKISKSSSNALSYSRTEDQQVIKYAHFRHGEHCPLENSKVLKNPERDMKPCACVLLFDKENEKFLITQRSANLNSFPSAWVLPGGHLQIGESLFEGGLRECEEEAGLPHSNTDNIPLKDQNIMIWESVFTVEQKIKACAIVVFFTSFCKIFPVKIDEKQVSDFKWKNLNDSSDEIPYNRQMKNGYAQGHRKYLEIVREDSKL